MDGSTTVASFRHAHLLSRVHERQGELLIAALTILRAHHLAGRPVPGDRRAPPRLTAWSHRVAATITWAGGANVLDVLGEAAQDVPCA